MTRPAETRPLHSLLEEVDMDPRVGETRVTGITADSRALGPGELFVAIRGTSIDGHDFIEEVVRAGAAAVVAEREVWPAPAIPVIVVENSRRALARLAAAWYGGPAEELKLLGISGTLGKTSVLSMLQEIMAEAGEKAGSIGSLGVFRGRTLLGGTGHTAPDPIQLHRNLARLRREGCELAMMEVTSHALAQERVHGLFLDAGIFTNIVPLEHQDYHGTFADYVAAKSRFFDHLKPGAPLIYNGDDLAVAGLVAERDLFLVGVGTAEEAAVRISSVRTSAAGTSFELIMERGVGDRTGGVAPRSMALTVQLLGRANVMNAALAATASVLLGVSSEHIAAALARIPPPRRRMELVQMGEFQILDDTVGHPESITAVFGVVESLSPRNLHIAFAVRGKRGAEINEQVATTLGTWLRKFPPATLVVTRSEDSADERNVVSEEEMAAFRSGLAGLEIPFEESAGLREAIGRVMDRAGRGDLILLLGAQGMDRGAEMARDWLAERTPSDGG